MTPATKKYTMMASANAVARASSLLLKAALLFRKGVVVVSVPYHLEI